MKLNLTKNKVSEKCLVLEGDNRENCPKNVADHVNLGLLPSAELSFEAACGALKQDFGGILHIHANVKTITDSKVDWQIWADKTRATIQNILGINWSVEQILIFPVKSFAPKVHHLVLDLKCVPNKSLKD